MTEAEVNADFDYFEIVDVKIGLCIKDGISSKFYEILTLKSSKNITDGYEYHVICRWGKIDKFSDNISGNISSGGIFSTYWCGDNISRAIAYADRCRKIKETGSGYTFDDEFVNLSVDDRGFFSSIARTSIVYDVDYEIKKEEHLRRFLKNYENATFRETKGGSKSVPINNLLGFDATGARRTAIKIHEAPAVKAGPASINHPLWGMF